MAILSVFVQSRGGEEVGEFEAQGYSFQRPSEGTVTQLRVNVAGQRATRQPRVRYPVDFLILCGESLSD